MYERRTPVHFDDIDPSGFVFYPRFFLFFHRAFERFFGDETAVPYPVWIDERRIGWPTVHIESDFRAPARYGMELAIRLGFRSIGRTSFTTVYEAADGATGKQLCTSAITVVTVRLDTMEPLPIPDEVRRALERHPAS